MGAEHLAVAAGGRRCPAASAGACISRARSRVAPDVLLLDEPFAGLDPEARALLLEDAGPALRAADRATLIVVHDRAEAWALADRLLIMIDGAIVADGPARASCSSIRPARSVARFLGFDGAVTARRRAWLTRPAHVVLDPSGPYGARVTRVVPLQDGVRLELALDAGRLFAVAPLPGPAVGDEVRVRLDGGVRLQPPSR